MSEWQWKKCLYDGVVEGTAWTPAAVGEAKVGAAAAGLAAALAKAELPGGGQYEVVFTPDAKVYDGRFANNGWLQELPGPMTRLTWDNAAIMSPATAKLIGVDDYDVVALDAGGGRTLEVAVYVMPGVADGVIGLGMGYGREAGSIATGAGFNAYKLRTSGGMGSVTVSVRPAGRKYELATVQQHHMVDTVGKKALQRRVPELIKEATFERYLRDGAKVPRVLSLSMFDERTYDRMGAGTRSKSGGWRWI